MRKSPPADIRAPQEQLAQDALQLALALGADHAAASVSTTREVEVAWRDGQLERITEATSRGLSVEVYVDGRYGAVSTSDLRPEVLRPLLTDAVEMTRALAPDPFRRLLEPELYVGLDLSLDPNALGLDLFDASYDSLTAAERREAAEAMEVAARGVPGADKILSVTSGVSDAYSDVYRCDSQGFAGRRTSTAFWRVCEVSVQDPDGRRPEESDYAGGRHRAAMLPAEVVGRSAAERTMARIGAQKPPTQRTRLLVDARAAGRLVGSLLGPLSGGALQQKRSFYDGKEGIVLGSPLLDLRDEPHVVRGLGSRVWDGEGMAARGMPVFARGQQVGLYIDPYYGRKLGRAPTSRGASNLLWTLGDKDLTALAQEAGSGILVTGFLGGNSNGTTGDFSFGVQGYAIEGGQIAGPLAEMNLAGNHQTFWQQLVAVGNDPYRWSSMATPTLVFDGVTVAGS